jgi:ATP-dependent DNA helicase PIF1
MLCKPNGTKNGFQGSEMEMNQPSLTRLTMFAKTTYIDLPHHLCIPNQSTESLIHFTFPDIREQHADTDSAWATWISDRAILTPLNATVIDINNRILEDYMPGDTSTYYSSDRPLPRENNGLDIPNEFLNALNESLPPHQLTFKKGVPVMLLRNTYPTNGICNGMRLIVDKDIEGNVLRATVAGNPTKVTLIPRIKLISNNPSFPF